MLIDFLKHFHYRGVVKAMPFLDGSVHFLIFMAKQELTSKVEGVYQNLPVEDKTICVFLFKDGFSFLPWCKLV